LHATMSLAWPRRDQGRFDQEVRLSVGYDRNSPTKR
jgi:hypothetical protein